MKTADCATSVFRMTSLVLAATLLVVATQATVAQNIPLPDVEGFWCYTCFDFTANDTWCRGANNLLNSQVAVRHETVVERYSHPSYGIRNCGRWAPYCVITEVYSADDTSKSLYVRDCSNGEDFSFTFLDGSRLTLNTTGTRVGAFLPSGTRAPNNRTVCMWSGEGQSQVCVTICSGDFCNGPQLQREEDTTDGGGGRNSCHVVLALVVVLLLTLSDRLLGLV
ncbi:uncharacterized protein [Littorina saxatilis]|uniref:Protein sleepless n=1 Tax=Littorina saxatilis TaxID=31220 RepID=A0AAN9AXL3_9CAEN